jgi:hypothetical protein
MMLLLVCGVVWIVLIISGCQQSDTVAVTGTVTMKGQPVDKAEVVFNPKKGRFASGVTDSQGHFSLSTAKSGDGAMPGEYTVTLGEYYPPDAPPAPPRGGGFLPSRFPNKYADPGTSPLNAKIDRGQKNDFQFEVK